MAPGSVWRYKGSASEVVSDELEGRVAWRLKLGKMIWGHAYQARSEQFASASKLSSSSAALI